MFSSKLKFLVYPKLTVDVKGDDDYVKSKNGKVHLLLLPETHSISYQSLQPGSTINYTSLLRDDQAESIGAGVPTYLKTLQTVGYIQKYGEEKNERREDYKQAGFFVVYKSN